MDRYKIIRYFAYTIEILILYMVQETPGLLPEIGGARPVLLIPAAISIAMFESELAGSPLAFCAACSWTSAWGAFWVSTACCWRPPVTGGAAHGGSDPDEFPDVPALGGPGRSLGFCSSNGYFSICSTATSTADMRWSHGTCRAWRIPSVQCRSVTHSTALWPSRSAQKRNSRRAGV